MVRKDSEITTRQQKRYAARQLAKHPTQQSKWQRGTQRALELLAPLKRLPWWTNVLGVIVTIYALWEIFVGTRPIVTTHPSSVPSSEPLPFIIRNQSIVFDMTNVVLTCQLARTSWGGVSVPPRTWVKGTFTTNVTGRILSKKRDLTIKSFGGVINFPCSTEGIESAELAGTPMQLQQMQLEIKVEYRTLIFDRTFISDVFTFEKMKDGSYEWFEGETVN